MSDAVVETIATQIPLAVLFSIFAYILFRMVLTFIEKERAASREERQAFLTAMNEITQEIKEMRSEIEDLKMRVAPKRRRWYSK